MKKTIFILMLALTGRFSDAQSFYGGFETWRDYSVITDPATTLHLPYGWYAADSLVFFAKGMFPLAQFTEQVYKTTDAHSGSFAAKLITLREDTFHVIPAVLTNANVALDASAFDPAHPQSGLAFTGGTPISSRMYGVSAWLKYFPAGGDTATIYVLAIRSGMGSSGDSVVGSGQLTMHGTVGSYTRFSIPISYTDTLMPDLVRIIAVSSGDNPHDSSTLYMDDVTVIPAGIISQHNTAGCMLHPNPVISRLTISGANGRMIMISNVQGQRIYCARYDAPVDVSALPTGIYTVQVMDDMGSVCKTEKMVKR